MKISIISDALKLHHRFVPNVPLSLSRIPVIRAYAFSSSTSLARSAQVTLDSSNEPNSNLPDAKLRLLISLYHQSGEFVTPENLDDKFNQAFTGLKASTDRQAFNYQSLEHAMEGRRSLPHLRPASIFHVSASEKSESHHLTLRTPSRSKIAETVAAVAGTTVIGGSPGYVGLEVVREEMAQHLEAGDATLGDSTSGDPSDGPELPSS